MLIKDWRGQKAFYKGKIVKNIILKGERYSPSGSMRYADYMVYTEGSERAFHAHGNEKLKRSKWI